jgi:hypothetical protein
MSLIVKRIKICKACDRQAFWIAFVAAVALAASAASLLPSLGERAADERLSFQTSHAWSPRTNLKADIAMVYDIGERMPENMESWRPRRTYGLASGTDSSGPAAVQNTITIAAGTRMLLLDLNRVKGSPAPSGCRGLPHSR